MVRFKIFVLCSLYFAVQLSCLASGHSFSRLTIENGLSNNHVNAIYEDSYGYIWLGTLDGIDRYDGVELRSFSNQFDGLVENVMAITEDFEKNIWVGTTTGIFRYQQASNKFERIDIDSIDLDVRTLLRLPDSTLCIGTTVGLYLLDAKSLHTEKLQLPNPDGNRPLAISGIFPDNHANIWIASTAGLIRYSFLSKKSELYQHQSVPRGENSSFTSICSIGNKLYLGTAGAGIVEFDLSSKAFFTGVETDNKIILNITSDGKELIFAGTDGGGLNVINVRTRKVKRIVSADNDPESLSSNSIYSFLKDTDGRYWVGTYSAGLCFSKKGEGSFDLHPITSSHPELNKSIRSFYFTPEGEQYFGTRNGFVQVAQDGTLKLFQASSKDGLRSNIILSIYPYNGDILVGTYGGGLSRFSLKEQRLDPFFDDGMLSQGNIYAFDTDRSGNLWITSFNGLYRYSQKDRRVVNFNRENSKLENDQVFEITFDSKGRMWVGSINGTFAYKLNGDKLEPINLEIIPNNTFKTNYIYEDQVGNIWICTERGGLIMVDPELSASVTYRNENGLPDNSICAIVEISTGSYWISTLKGICRYSNQSQKFTSYTMSSGLPGLVFTPAAAYLAPDGKLFFGNEKGLVYFTPEDVGNASLSSKMVITDFYVSGNEVSPGEGSVLDRRIEETKVIHLKDKMNNIGFRFALLNYANPMENFYLFKLEGYDTDWRSNGHNNTVFYQNLKSGNYVFKVKNAYGGSDDLTSMATVEVNIHRSFTRSVFFYLIIFGCALVGGFVLVRYIKMLQGKLKQKVDLPQKAPKYKGSRIAKSQSDIIVAELKRYMENDKPYLNADLKLADLANEINHPMNDISQVLNQDLNQSFSDFVNRYRVEEVIRRMEDKAYEKFTFVAIAQQCGFNSKTSFYRIFKNETGKTPADYLKSLVEQEKP
ncbi:two-component regulator propeller domain-containing protein [Mangrovibacterium sp.]|uniref:two-component regulator propeller domain-containing protein n=1 Tax=Mangrovibacterium sp. TaxID=1961364 RepID=UPI00356291CB